MGGLDLGRIPLNVVCTQLGLASLGTKSLQVLLASPPLRDCTTNFSAERTQIDKADAAVLRRLGMKRVATAPFRTVTTFVA